MNTPEVEAASWLAVFEEKVERLQQNFRDAVEYYRGQVETLTRERDRARELLAQTEKRVCDLIANGDKPFAERLEKIMYGELMRHYEAGKK